MRKKLGLFLGVLLVVLLSWWVLRTSTEGCYAKFPQFRKIERCRNLGGLTWLGGGQRSLRADGIIDRGFCDRIVRSTPLPSPVFPYEPESYSCDVTHLEKWWKTDCAALGFSAMEKCIECAHIGVNGGTRHYFWAVSLACDAARAFWGYNVAAGAF